MKKIFLILFGLSAVSLSPIAQVVISGPDCVKAGEEYNYAITSATVSVIRMQVCVKGGNIVDSVSDCVSANSSSLIRIIWNQTESNGSITLTSASGNATKNVVIAPSLAPGSVLSSDKRQTIDYDKKPALITCSAAKGGGCRDVFVYQWQSSHDNVSWTEVPGETSQNLSLNSTLTESTFFRRRVTHVVSNSVDYSDVVTVFVNPEPPK